MREKAGGGCTWWQQWVEVEEVEVEEVEEGARISARARHLCPPHSLYLAALSLQEETLLKSDQKRSEST